MIFNWMWTRGNALSWKTPTFPLVWSTHACCLLSPALLLLHTSGIHGLEKVMVHPRRWHLSFTLLPRHRDTIQLSNHCEHLLWKLRDSSRSLGLLKIWPHGKDPGAGVKVGSAAKPTAPCQFRLVSSFWDRSYELERWGQVEEMTLLSWELHKQGSKASR